MKIYEPLVTFNSNSFCSYRHKCIAFLQKTCTARKDIQPFCCEPRKKLITLPTKDRYLDLHECVKRLFRDYIAHENLFVAFDFDSTVFDYFKIGDTYPKIEEALRLIKEYGFTLILFTGNEGDKLTEIIKYCEEHGYKPDLVNENPIMQTRKPYYNILLDDRAGLNDAYQTLIMTLKLIKQHVNG